jgi:phage N-6-adenine-methyltransferase
LIDKNDFRTPKEFFNGIEAVWGEFQLDAAANCDNHLCKRYYTIQHSGLINDWQAGQVWCNPPYDSPEKWIKKAIKELDKENCNLVAMLLPVDTSTRWFHNFILERSCEIYFVLGRLSFSGPNSMKNASSPRANLLCILTKDGYKSKRMFGSMTKKGLPLQNQLTLSQFC